MNIPFILIATVPMIIGLVWIYRSFRRELRDSEIAINRTHDNTLKHFYDIKRAIERDISYDKVMRDIHKSRGELLGLESKRNIKESELQAYLEHRFRAESDEFAMNKKIDKIKNEYDESIFTDSLGNKLDYNREDISWRPPTTCRCQNKKY